MDIEVLLRGAEKLCTVYPAPDALRRIPALRQRYAHQCESEQYHEERVAEQSEKLGRMNKDMFEDDEDEEEVGAGIQEDAWTGEELRRAEQEMRELERKKRELQERLRDLDKDLGGLPY